MLHITNHNNSGKLAGFKSINTSTLDNEFCHKMMASSYAVCGSCYAGRTEKLRPSLKEAIAKNNSLLSDSIIPWDNLPRFFNERSVRLHSFGELINDIHLINFINICLKNPDVTFTLWTKRRNIINSVFTEMKKPDNLILILSTTSLDVEITKVPEYFDKVFSVFTKKGKPGNVDINCHSKCRDCMLCYTKNDIAFVNEYKK